MGHDSKKKPSAEAWVRGIKHPDILVTNIFLSIVKIYLSMFYHDLGLIVRTVKHPVSLDRC